MRCSKVQYFYEEYVSGRVDPALALRIDAHLAMCEACREAYEENDDLSQLLSDSCEVVHPGAAYLEALTRRVTDSLYDETGEFVPAAEARQKASTEPAVVGGRRTVQPLWWAGALAATLLVVPMIGSALLGGGGSAPVASQAPQRVVAAADAGAAGAVAQGDASEAVAYGPAEARESFTGTTIEKSPLEQGDAARGQAFGGSAPDGDLAGIQTVSRLPGSFGRALERMAAEEGELTTLEELVALEAVATPEARQRIFQLLRELGDRLAETSPDEIQGGWLTGERLLAAQTSHYHRAENAADRGAIDEAVEHYERILTINPTTILGRRAALRVADLYYYRQADFERALSRYALCSDQPANLALTRAELDHVYDRLAMLRRYESEGWAPLAQVHRIGTEPWNAVPGAFGELAAGAQSPELIEEAVFAVVRRLAAHDLPGDETAFDLIDVVETRLASEHNVEAQGWLRILMGDLIWVQFEGQEPAIEAYEHAVDVAGQTEAGRTAAERLAVLRDDSFAVFSSAE